MKAILTTLFLLVGLIGFGQYTQYTPDTLVNGKIPVTVYISPDASFPFEALVLNRNVVIMTVNQARGLSMYAGKTDKIDSLNISSQVADRLLLMKIDELEGKVGTTEQSLQAAILSYETEKLKNENNQTAMQTKDELIKVQQKEIRRQKALKWAFAIGGGALTTLAIITR